MPARFKASSLFSIFLVILSAGLWATVGVATRLVPEAQSLSPEAWGLVRTLIAGPAILLFCLPRLKSSLPALRRLRPADLLSFALASVIFQVCLFRSFDLLGVTVTVFLTVCLPPVLALGLALTRRAAVGGFGLLALALAIAGLAVFTAGGWTGAGGPHLREGLLLALAASIAFVWMSEAARRLGQVVSPILVAGLGLTLAGLIFCAASPFLFAAPLDLAGQMLTNPRLLALGLYLALVPTALAYICYCTGIARCRSTLAGLTASMVEPAIAALLAARLLTERLSPAELLGCALVALALGVLLAAEARRRPVTA